MGGPAWEGQLERASMGVSAWECQHGSVSMGVPAWECQHGSASMGVSAWEPAWEGQHGRASMGVPAWECQHGSSSMGGPACEGQAGQAGRQGGKCQAGEHVLRYGGGQCGAPRSRLGPATPAPRPRAPRGLAGPATAVCTACSRRSASGGSRTARQPPGMGMGMGRQSFFLAKTITGNCILVPHATASHATASWTLQNFIKNSGRSA